MIRQNSNLILLIALVAAFIGGSLLLSRGTDQRVADPRRSSFNNRPAGVKAWYLLLQESGRDCRRWTGSLESLPAGGSLIIVRPTLPISGPEAQALVRWVRRGGRLCYLSEEPGAVDQAFHLTLRPSQAAAQAVPALLPTPLGRAAPRVWAGGERMGVRDGRWVAEYGDRKGFWLVRSIVGRGTVLVAADSSPLANENLTRADDAAFALALPGPGTIWFEEAHHGYGSSGSSLWNGLSVPVRRAILQCLLALALMLWGASRRFGAPLPEDPQFRRVPGEYVESLARLLRKGRGGTAAVATLREAMRRDLRIRLGLLPDATDADIVEAAPGRVRNPADLQQLFLDLSRPTGPADVLELAQRIHSVREELNLESGSESATRSPVLPV